MRFRSALARLNASTATVKVAKTKQPVKVKPPAVKKPAKPKVLPKLPPPPTFDPPWIWDRMIMPEPSTAPMFNVNEEMTFWARTLNRATNRHQWVDKRTGRGYWVGDSYQGNPNAIVAFDYPPTIALESRASGPAMATRTMNGLRGLTDPDTYWNRSLKKPELFWAEYSEPQTTYSMEALSPLPASEYPNLQPDEQERYIIGESSTGPIYGAPGFVPYEHHEFPDPSEVAQARSGLGEWTFSEQQFQSSEGDYSPGWRESETGQTWAGSEPPPGYTPSAPTPEAPLPVMVNSTATISPTQTATHTQPVTTSEGDIIGFRAADELLIAQSEAELQQSWQNVASQGGSAHDQFNRFVQLHGGGDAGGPATLFDWVVANNKISNADAQQIFNNDQLLRLSYDRRGSEARDERMRTLLAQAVIASGFAYILAGPALAAGGAEAGAGSTVVSAPSVEAAAIESAISTNAFTGAGGEAILAGEAGGDILATELFAGEVVPFADVAAGEAAFAAEASLANVVPFADVAAGEAALAQEVMIQNLVPFADVAAGEAALAAEVQAAQAAAAAEAATWDSLASEWESAVAESATQNAAISQFGVPPWLTEAATTAAVSQGAQSLFDDGTQIVTDPGDTFFVPTDPDEPPIDPDEPPFDPEKPPIDDDTIDGGNGDTTVDGGDGDTTVDGGDNDIVDDAIDNLTEEQVQDILDDGELSGSDWSDIFGPAWDTLAPWIQRELIEVLKDKIIHDKKPPIVVKPPTTTPKPPVTPPTGTGKWDWKKIGLVAAAAALVAIPLARKPQPKRYTR